jgi:hypothetical protein
MAIECSKYQTENPATARFCPDYWKPIGQSKTSPVTETVRIRDHGLALRTTLAGCYKIIEKIGAGGMKCIMADTQLTP